MTAPPPSNISFFSGKTIDFQKEFHDGNKAFLFVFFEVKTPNVSNVVVRMNKFQQKFPNLIVTAFLQANVEDDIQKWVEKSEEKMEFPVCFDKSETIFHAYLGSVVDHLPAAVVVDKTSHLFWSGSANSTELDSAVEKAASFDWNVDCASKTEEEMHSMHVQELKNILHAKKIPYDKHVLEKQELIDLIPHKKVST